MIIFGLLSTVFDYATFGIFLFILHTVTNQFRTAKTLTRKPLFRSKPGKHLLFATLFIVAVTIVLPFTPAAELFSFKGLPALYLYVIGIIILIYVVTAEIVKKIFYKRIEF